MAARRRGTWLLAAIGALAVLLAQPTPATATPTAAADEVVADWHTLRTPPLAPGQIELLTLSTLPDAVTGGDVLVEVRGLADGDDLVVTRDGIDVSAVFNRSGGTARGLVTGLLPGANALEATAHGQVARLVVHDHPVTGPVLSGPHQTPFRCTTERVGLGPALDADCSAAPKVQWFARTSGDQAFHELADPFAPYPADTVLTETSDGAAVPFVVRVESRTINRGIVRIAVLDDPHGARTRCALRRGPVERPGVPRLRRVLRRGLRPGSEQHRHRPRQRRPDEHLRRQPADQPHRHHRPPRQGRHHHALDAHGVRRALQPPRQRRDLDDDQGAHRRAVRARARDRRHQRLGRRAPAVQRDQQRTGPSRRRHAERHLRRHRHHRDDRERLRAPAPLLRHQLARVDRRAAGRRRRARAPRWDPAQQHLPELDRRVPQPHRPDGGLRRPRRAQVRPRGQPHRRALHDPGRQRQHLRPRPVHGLRTTAARQRRRAVRAGGAAQRGHRPRALRRPQPSRRRLRHRRPPPAGAARDVLRGRRPHLPGRRCDRPRCHRRDTRARRRALPRPDPGGQHPRVRAPVRGASPPPRAHRPGRQPGDLARRAHPGRRLPDDGRVAQRPRRGPPRCGGRPRCRRRRRQARRRRRPVRLRHPRRSPRAARLRSSRRSACSSCPCSRAPPSPTSTCPLRVDVPEDFDSGLGPCSLLLPVVSTPRMVAGMPLSDDIIKCQLKPHRHGRLPRRRSPRSSARQLEAAFPTGVCDFTKPAAEDVERSMAWASIGGDVLEPPARAAPGGWPAAALRWSRVAARSRPRARACRWDSRWLRLRLLLGCGGFTSRARSALHPALAFRSLPASPAGPLGPLRSGRPPAACRWPATCVDCRWGKAAWGRFRRLGPPSWASAGGQSGGVASRDWAGPGSSSVLGVRCTVPCMLEMREVCERCETALVPGGEARICSYECTFCPTCSDEMAATCPNCGGELVARPRRVG